MSQSSQVIIAKGIVVTCANILLLDEVRWIGIETPSVRTAQLSHPILCVSGINGSTNRID